MSVPLPTIADEIVATLPQHDRLRLAERVLVEAGFTSLLPSLNPITASLPEPEARALAAVGLKRTAQTRAVAESARATYVATFLDLFRQGDTPGELACKLGLDPSRIRQRLRERSLLSVELNDERRIPWFQFEDGIEIPGLSRLLAATTTLTPLAFAMWSLSPTTELESDDDDATPQSPREWLLRTGDVERVLVLARQL